MDSDYSPRRARRNTKILFLPFEPFSVKEIIEKSSVFFDLLYEKVLKKNEKIKGTEFSYR